jgi:hypothetical protein
MRIPLLFVMVTVSACAGRYRTEPLGMGNAIIQPRGGDVAAPTAAEDGRPWAVGGGMQLPAGTYDLELAFDIPRAQVIDWTVNCPGAVLNGTAGETLDQFRARRVAQIRAERQRDRETAATAANIVLGAVTPTVRAGNATVSAHVHVDAGIDQEPVFLAPDDVGRGRLTDRVRVVTTGDGVCAVIASTEDANVLGSYRVTRVRDLQAEARARATTERAAALEVRGQVSGQLVTAGASPAVRQARIDADAAVQARARADAAARAQVAIDIEARARTGAYEWRREYLAYLEGECNADPNHRNEVATERTRVAQVKVDRLQVRLDMALRTRAQLSYYFIQQGAIARPPMPARIAEVAGAVPFDGAQWNAGTWVWVNGKWEWHAGYWSDPDVFSSAGGPDNVAVGGAVESEDLYYDDGITNPPYGYSSAVRDHRTKNRNPSSWKSTSAPDATVRDHRSSSSSWKSSSSPDANVRDHRSESKDDKKDDDDDKKDYGGGRFVRDHR